MLQPKQADDAERSTPYLNAGLLSAMNLVNHNDLPEMFASIRDRAKYSIRAGDLIVAEGGDVGQTAFVPDGLPTGTIIQNSLHRVRGRDADVRFLRYALDSVRGSGWIAVVSNRATFGHLTKEKLEAVTVPAPPQQLQRAIAHHLDRETARIDALIDKKHLLTGLLGERELAVRTSLVLEDEQGQAYPRVRLRFLVPRIGVGLVINPSTYAVDDGVPFLHGYHITPEGIVFEPPKYMSDHHSKALSASRLHAGDVVVVRAGYPGRAVVVPPEYEGANCASILIIRRGGRLIPEFLANYLNSADGARQVSLAQYGAAQEQINVGHIVNFMVPAPQPQQQTSALTRRNATCNRRPRSRRQ